MDSKEMQSLLASYRASGGRLPKSLTSIILHSGCLVNLLILYLYVFFSEKDFKKANYNITIK